MSGFIIIFKWIKFKNIFILKCIYTYINRAYWNKASLGLSVIFQTVNETET